MHVECFEMGILYVFRGVQVVCGLPVSAVALQRRPLEDHPGLVIGYGRGFRALQIFGSMKTRKF